MKGYTVWKGSMFKGNRPPNLGWQTSIFQEGRLIFKEHNETVNLHTSSCHEEQESADHLFLFCNLARVAWFGSNISLANCESIMVHLTSKFEKQKVNPMATIYQAKELACQWSKAFNEETHAHDTNNLGDKGRMHWKYDLILSSISKLCSNVIFQQNTSDDTSNWTESRNRQDKQLKEP
ncbi:hypothetical protein GOBAR_DD18339 [Gossypium barbadense]|nr:hypothetical protein GOBAR_DD18339 [Gossypium barbadense]